MVPHIKQYSPAYSRAIPYRLLEIKCVFRAVEKVAIFRFFCLKFGSVFYFHPAKVRECRLRAIEPFSLRRLRVGFDIEPPGITQRGHEQMNLLLARCGRRLVLLPRRRSFAFLDRGILILRIPLKRNQRE